MAASVHFSRNFVATFTWFGGEFSLAEILFDKRNLISVNIYSYTRDIICDMLKLIIFTNLTFWSIAVTFFQIN